MLHATTVVLFTVTFAQDPPSGGGFTSGQCQSQCDPNSATNSCATHYGDTYKCGPSPYDSTCYICVPSTNTWPDPVTQDPLDPFTTPDPCASACVTNDDCCGNTGIACSRECVDPSTLTVSGGSWYNLRKCNVCVDTTTYPDPVSTELPVSTMEKCPTSECSIAQDCYSTVSGSGQWTSYQRMKCTVDDSTGCGVCEELCGATGQCQYPGHYVAGDCDIGQICKSDPYNGECGKCVDDPHYVDVSTLEPVTKSTIDCECIAADVWKSCSRLSSDSTLSFYTKYECINIDTATGCGECAELCTEPGQCTRFGSSYECESGQICVQDAIGNVCGQCVDIEVGSTEEPLSTIDCDCTENTVHADCYDVYSSSVWTTDKRYICSDIDDSTGCGTCKEVTKCGECETNWDCNQHKDTSIGTVSGGYTRKYAMCEKDDQGCGECVDYDPYATTSIEETETAVSEVDVSDVTDAANNDDPPNRTPYQPYDGANGYGLIVAISFGMVMVSWM